MNIFIVGIGGKMGKALIERAGGLGCTISGGLDRVKAADYPTFAKAEEVNVPIDVVIDFSRPETLGEIEKLCEKLRCPCVLATTGYSDEQEQRISKLAKRVAVFKSGNMSLGINALSILAEKAAAILKDFDVEIIERHHNQKADAPSGTAKLLAKALEKGLDYTPDYRYGRVGAAKREPQEIGIHAVRGGTIVGEHEISFCGNREVVTLSHSAESREIFADGALRAALWLKDKKQGLYDMHDLLGM